MGSQQNTVPERENAPDSSRDFVHSKVAVSCRREACLKVVVAPSVGSGWRWISQKLCWEPELLAGPRRASDAGLVNVF